MRRSAALVLGVGLPIVLTAAAAWVLLEKSSTGNFPWDHLLSAKALAEPISFEMRRKEVLRQLGGRLEPASGLNGAVYDRISAGAMAQNDDVNGWEMLKILEEYADGRMRLELFMMWVKLHVPQGDGTTLQLPQAAAAQTPAETRSPSLPVLIPSTPPTSVTVDRIAAPAAGSDAATMLARAAAYANGEAGAPDPDLQLMWLKRAAETGDSRGLWALGQYYEQYGPLSSAVETYRRLAASPDTQVAREAAWMLSTLYFDGHGRNFSEKMETDNEQALAWAKKAVQEVPYAQVPEKKRRRLAVLNAAVLGTRGRDAAVYWVTGSVGGSDAHASYTVANELLTVGRFDSLGIEWLKSAEKGLHAQAAAQLGEIYFAGRHGVTPDWRMAKRYFESGASQGSWRALVGYWEARMRESKQSDHLNRCSAGLMHALQLRYTRKEAAYRMLCILAKAEIVHRRPLADLIEALEKVGEKHPPAYSILAQLYREGKQVEKDEAAADRYEELAHEILNVFDTFPESDEKFIPQVKSLWAARENVQDEPLDLEGLLD